MYKKFGSDLVVLRPWFIGIPEIYTVCFLSRDAFLVFLRSTQNNIEVARQVAIGGHKTSFLKPAMATQALLYVARLLLYRRALNAEIILDSGV